MSQNTDKLDPLTEEQTCFLSETDLNKQFLKLSSASRDLVMRTFRQQIEIKLSASPETATVVPKGQLFVGKDFGNNLGGTPPGGMQVPGLTPDTDG